MRFIILLLLISCTRGAANLEEFESFTLFSNEVSDSFQIIIRKPVDFNPEKSYNIIYAADGGIKLGSYLLGTDSSWKADLPDDCIVVTIGHFGNWHEKRRRDFLPSDAGGYSDEAFGQASKFYQFLKNTLIPKINNHLPNRKSTAFIGHSFSGLFCLYTLFQEDKLFDRHFAISPSVWANEEELMKMEENFSKKNRTLKANVSLQAGGLEIFNKVLSSTKEFHRTMKERNYEGMNIEFSTVGNANHYSIIKPGVDKALKQFSSAH